MKISRAKEKRSPKGCVIAALVALSAVLAAAGVCALTAPARAEEKAALFLPESYEQYLELETPSRAAFSERHLAIVDGKTLYVYDREEQRYSSLTLENDATQIGFSGERLFLSDRSTVLLNFYEYDFDAGTLNAIPGINCSTFCIDGDVLYTATVAGSDTTIGKLSISSLEGGARAEDLGTVSKHVTPSMTVLGGTLQCTFDAAVYSVANGKLDVNNPRWLSENPSEVEDVRATCALGGDLYYTASGGLYRVGTAGPLLAGEGFGHLFAFGDSLYVVTGKAVREIALNSDGAHFTDYEITSASASENRLDGAVDTARSGGLIVTADAGNRRVTVYSEKERSFRALPLASTPSLVATDGSLIAAAAGSRVFYGEGLTTFVDTDERVLGLACVYGYVYYVTETDYGCIAPDGTQTEVFHSGHGSPAALAADAYGDLFVAMADGKIYRFSEQDFLDERAGGVLLEGTLPAGAKSLRADSEGDLFYLLNDSLCRIGETAPVLTLASDYVYTMSEVHPLAFALGYEDDAAYFLFGDFMTQQRGLPVSTLATISAEGAYASVSVPHPAEDVETSPVYAREIGIRIDLSVLTDESVYFAYAGRERIPENAEGVILAKTAEHCAVAIYEDHESTVYLFRNDGVRPTDPLPHEQAAGRRYVTSDVYLYHFPTVLLDSRTEVVPTHSEEALKRGTRVELVATAEAPERTFAYVRAGENEGYVPLSYLSEVDPFAGENDEYLWGRLRGDFTFVDEKGGTHVLTAGTQVRLTEEEGGYFARYTAEDGEVYSAHLKTGDIDRGENDALRIALIVILSVLAVLIVAVYIYLLPRKPRSA